jgi:hypothetical protein
LNEILGNVDESNICQAVCTLRDLKDDVRVEKAWDTLLGMLKCSSRLLVKVLMSLPSFSV